MRAKQRREYRIEPIKIKEKEVKMRILTPHTSPKISAQILDDKTLKAQVMESAKVLSAIIKKEFKYTFVRICENGTITADQLYKGYITDPSLYVWCDDNRIWIFRNLLYLLQEYERRFNKIHKAAIIYDIYFELSEAIGSRVFDIGDVKLSEPAPMTKSMLKVIENSKLTYSYTVPFYADHIKYLAEIAHKNGFQHENQSIFLEFNEDNKICIKMDSRN